MQKGMVTLTVEEWSMICDALSCEPEAGVDLIVMKIGSLVDALRIVRKERDELKKLLARARSS